MLPTATAHFQSTGASFKQAILCHPEPLEIHSLMPLHITCSILQGIISPRKAEPHCIAGKQRGVACPLFSRELDHQLYDALFPPVELLNIQLR